MTLPSAPPWHVDAPRRAAAAPAELREVVADVAIVGAGLTGLATARELLARRPELRVVVLEAARVGAGASGATGALLLDGTSGDPEPRFEGCLAALERVVREEAIDCDLRLGRCWRVARREAAGSPIAWNDSGTLRVVGDEPGGVLDSGKLLGGLWRAVERRGGRVREGFPVYELPAAPAVVLATGGQSLALVSGAPGITLRWTFALRIARCDFVALGWHQRAPFYTEDLPYLWGRPHGDGAIFGSGLARPGDLAAAEQCVSSLERRVRGLHPSLSRASVTHRWHGPESFAGDWQPKVEVRELDGRSICFAAGYAGHGVALAFRVAEIFADALCGTRSR